MSQVSIDKSVIDVYRAIVQLLDEAGFSREQQLFLAYSGGVDSQVLAHGLSLLKQQKGIAATLIYVHHGLSKNADDWALHCKQQALAYGLTCDVVKVNVARGARLSIEAEARNARYQAFKDHMQAGDLLLTAHHLDDQLETVLLALKRGLGPKGLAAMGKIQTFDADKWLARPLLNCSRTEIEGYAQHWQLSHIEDESNQDTRFDRNFLRLEIIPKLKQRWPAIATTASRSARLCAEQQQIIEQQLTERLPDLIDIDRQFGLVRLDLDKLSLQSLQWQKLLVRSYMQSLNMATPSEVQLEQVLQQLFYAKDDAKINLVLGQIQIRRFQHFAYFSTLTDYQLSSQAFTVPDDRQAFTIVLPHGELRFSPCYGQGMKLAAGTELFVDYQLSGQMKVQPVQRSKSRELKKVWQEFAIAPWLRPIVPMLMSGKRLVGAAGIWVEKPYQVNDNDPAWLCQFKLAQ
ncbi:tRNA lysidine(34) synthetase TilS [Shewanella marina]|uniref:tRNA lysidine(34) synthetase TilS n=1 Tax=Shewanella marina TaxID=487319 RepID=UPI0004716B2E|nr:tRNA lysidine(34) synthetase TilS [Shewanella marina]